MDEIPKIIAKTIDLRHIKVKCCFCNKVHTHGSSKDLQNREEMRVSHCDENKEYIIVIDDTTKKDPIPLHIKYADTVAKHRGEKFNIYCRERYFSLNEDKMKNHMIRTIENHPTLLQDLMKHFLLKAINE